MNRMNEQSEIRMIDCQESERRLHRYLDRELSEVEAAEVQQHLEACENCRARFHFESSLRQLVRRAASDESVPVGLTDRIRRLRGRSG